MTSATFFSGDFDFLPFRSHIDSGPLPAPTSDAFQLASCAAVSALDACNGMLTIEAAALVWRMEAIRARRVDDNADVCSREVMNRVAARLHAAAIEAA